MNQPTLRPIRVPVRGRRRRIADALFWQAHWIVKASHARPEACSVWVWPSPSTRRSVRAGSKKAMDRFEQAFWSDSPIEELYRALSANPRNRWRRCSSPPM